MRFSKTELKLLEQVALGKSRVPDLSAALKRDKSQTYRVIRSLRQKGFLGLKSGKADASRALHVQLLLGQLSRQPSFVGDLSGCGLKLCLFILDSPKSMREITKATGISADTVFCKLRAARGKSLIKTEGGRYRFNGELWKGLKEFLAELKRYEESYDSRIPPGSSIYRRAGEEIVFSTKAECDAALTGFSAYERYGIKVYPADNNYCLPKRKLSKKEVFMHSVYRCAKDGSVQNLIILALFYLKHKKSISGIRHEVLEKIRKVLKGRRVEGYPTLSEIRDRAEAYDVKIQRS